VGDEARGGQLKQFTRQIAVATRGKGLYDIGRQVTPWVEECGLRTGLLTVFVQHTSASLVIQENADPDVVRDLNDFFARLAPEDQRLYRHTVEGPDDMPAHIRAALTQTHLAIPVQEGRLVLGTWQGIYLFEHRAANHRRNVVLHLIGE
jgi:secondary thiamine-phosphate synthase enzyme